MELWLYRYLSLSIVRNASTYRYWTVQYSYIKKTNTNIGQKKMLSYKFIERNFCGAHLYLCNNFSCRLFSVMFLWFARIFQISAPAQYELQKKNQAFVFRFVMFWSVENLKACKRHIDDKRQTVRWESQFYVYCLWFYLFIFPGECFLLFRLCSYCFVIYRQFVVVA